MNIKLFLSMVLVYKCLALSDYCKIENNYCAVKHIGCANNVNGLRENFERFTKGITNTRPVQLTDRQRNEIFYKINLFKNKIASGKLGEIGFPSAAQMNKISWNDEMEYLAKLYALKIPLDIHLCTLTESSMATYYLVYQNSGSIENIDQFIEDGIQSFFGELKQKNLPWISSYFAETEHIGCGIAEFTVPIGNGAEKDVVSNDIVEGGNGTILVGTFLSMRCIFDTISESRDTYQTGEPCSLCKSGICDEIFPSLCKE